MTDRDQEPLPSVSTQPRVTRRGLLGLLGIVALPVRRLALPVVAAAPVASRLTSRSPIDLEKILARFHQFLHSNPFVK